MKKPNFKKLAMMGMASGMMLGAQASVNADTSNAGITLASSCGGRGSCGGMYQPQPNTGRGSCGSQPQPNSGRSSCGSQAQPRGSRYMTADADNLPQQQERMAHGKMMTENEFIPQLSPQGKSLYMSLDREGKKEALRTASQYSDKNEAVRMAAKKMEMQSGRPMSSQPSSMNDDSSYNNSY